VTLTAAELDRVIARRGERGITPSVADDLNIRGGHDDGAIDRVLTEWHVDDCPLPDVLGRRIDERLDDGGNRVPDVQRARDLLVAHDLPELERRCRRRKAADAEGVPEVGNEADAELSR